MGSILLIGGAFIVGVVAGCYFQHRNMKTLYSIDPDEAINMLSRGQRNDSERFTELTVEKHEGQIFLSFAESGMFVSQGKSIDDALDIAHERFPSLDFTFIIDEEDVPSLTK